MKLYLQIVSLLIVSFASLFWLVPTMLSEKSTLINLIGCALMVATVFFTFTVGYHLLIDVKNKFIEENKYE